MALGFVVILLIIYGIFELLTILSIIFSAVSLTKSKKYVALNGNYSFKSVKRFHSASVVFFVFGCIGFPFIGFALLAYITEMEGPIGGEAVFYIVQLAKYIAFFALGIMSFMKFSAASSLNRSLYYAYSAGIRNYGQPAGQYPNGAYNRYPNQQQVYYQGQYQQQGGYPQQNSYNSAPTFSTDENKPGRLPPSTAEKRCSKCGAVNDKNFNFCISCGEKLEEQ